MNGDTLTAFQRGGADLPFDLATGYPRVEDSNWLLDRVRPEPPKLQLSFGPLVSEFIGAASHVLGIGRERQSLTRVVATGSIGLDRTFRALDILARDRGLMGVGLIVAEPALDLYRLMAAERNWVSRGVPSPQGASAEQAPRLLAEVERLIAEAPFLMPVVLLASPGNPTGVVLNSADLEALAEGCRALQAILVLDHCFSRAGVHVGVVAVPHVWSALAESDCDWFGLWDSGKTLGLAGKKLGLVVGASPLLVAALDAAIDVLQGEIDQGMLRLLTLIMGNPHFEEYCSRLAMRCRSNYLNLTRMLMFHPDVSLESGVTFARIGLGNSGRSGREFVIEAAALGVSTVSSEHFGRGTNDADWVRVSLARDEDYFNRAITALEPCFY